MAVETQRDTMTVDQAARRLGISRNSCYTLAAKGELPGAIRLGKRIVVSIYQFERFLRGEGKDG
ncbi:helix-turn-helix domain-containing protein [Candidatus Magnetobacterium casense]|uniref:Helix-turn-helix domain-containing protein n=1 Tax=Candidatus Magnetobacterium casense TaxID=1455061 RepID=A0ABS6S2W3_9BACT|nr:helix-turn-helix domain-containing protein [Candidatus Magnetobacterium casensis]MBV6343176.1 helix-turn-helix domain-containing protein [Candidatus Magnetobacterium casensis]